MSETPSWLPDWRDEAGYAFPGAADEIYWAWEFLRRNPAYRDDWARYARVIGPAPGDLDTFLAEEWPYLEAGFKARNPTLPLDGFDCKPPAAAGETLGHYVQRFEDGPDETRFSFQRLDFGLTETYGVEAIWDPAENRPAGFALRLRRAGAAAEVRFTFSLARPLDPQLARARKALTQARKLAVELAAEGGSEAGSGPAGRYRIYLRLLDAEAAGVAPGDAAALLYPQADGDGMARTLRGERDLAAARQLRDGGYLRFALEFDAPA
jgi:hypothetical protein